MRTSDRTRSPRTLFSRALPAAVVAVILAALTAGCSNTTVVVHSGPVFGPKRVKVGETFDVVTQGDPKTGADWNLQKYDMTMVQLAAMQRYNPAEAAALKHTTSFIALKAGRTTMDYALFTPVVLKAGEKAPKQKTKTLKLRIE